MAHTLEQVAEAIIAQNPDLKALIKDNAGANYHLVEARVKPIMRQVGQATGEFVPVNRLVWALIDEVEGANAIPRVTFSL